MAGDIAQRPIGYRYSHQTHRHLKITDRQTRSNPDWRREVAATPHIADHFFELAAHQTTRLVVHWCTTNGPEI
jgi:hypothetical protein